MPRRSLDAFFFESDIKQYQQLMYHLGNEFKPSGYVSFNLF